MSADRAVTGPAVRAPAFESLEPRRLYAADKLALVHQELHRPPTAIIDLNGDRLDDMVVMTERTAAGDGVGIDVFLNDGTGALRFASHTDCDDRDPNFEVAAADLAAGDVDGDGAPDVVVRMLGVATGDAGLGDKTKVYAVPLINTGKGELLHTAAHELAHTVQQRPGVALRVSLDDEQDGAAIGDLNGDGVGDIVSVLGDEVCVSLMTKSGAKQVSKVEVKGWDWTTKKAVIGLADLSGDGRPDLLATFEDGLYALSFDIDATGTPVEGKVTKIDALTIKQGTHVALGDVDADGRADDLVVLDGPDLTLGVNDSESGAGFRWVQLGGPFRGSHAAEQLFIGDVDGDGFDDLFTLKKAAHEIAMNSIRNMKA